MVERILNKLLHPLHHGGWNHDVQLILSLQFVSFIHDFEDTKLMIPMQMSNKNEISLEQNLVDDLLGPKMLTQLRV